MPTFRSLCKALESKLGPAAKAKSDLAADKRPAVGVCVLPFVNMSGEAEQEYFSDGISEDIITDLSKVSSLFVVARNTAFRSRARTSTWRRSCGSSR